MAPDGAESENKSRCLRTLTRDNPSESSTVVSAKADGALCSIIARNTTMDNCGWDADAPSAMPSAAAWTIRPIVGVMDFAVGDRDRK